MALITERVIEMRRLPRSTSCRRYRCCTKAQCFTDHRCFHWEL